MTVWHYATFRTKPEFSTRKFLLLYKCSLKQIDKIFIFMYVHHDYFLDSLPLALCAFNYDPGADTGKGIIYLS